MTLRELIEFADKQAEKIFRQTGELHPMYHAIKRNGQHIITLQPSPDKDVSALLMRATFELEDVEMFVFMSEAWTLHAKNAEEIDMKRSLEHHADRREAIIFAAENDRGEMQTASRFILRPEHAKATLSPLKMDDMTGLTSSGRMVGMLKRRVR